MEVGFTFFLILARMQDIDPLMISSKFLILKASIFSFLYIKNVFYELTLLPFLQLFKLLQIKRKLMNSTKRTRSQLKSSKTMFCRKLTSVLKTRYAHFCIPYLKTDTGIFLKHISIWIFFTFLYRIFSEKRWKKILNGMLIGHLRATRFEIWWGGPVISCRIYPTRGKSFVTP